MPFVSRDLLRVSLDALQQDYSPLLAVSLPCMLAKKIPTCASMAEARKKAIDFGSREEREWLDAYFRFPGGPVGSPYYMPGTGGWVQDRYPDRSLQRRRKDFDGTVFFHPDDYRWALKQGASKVLKSKVLEDKPRIPLIALMAWMWRDRELTNTEDALSEFINTVGFKRDNLLESIYSATIPPEFKDAGLADTPLSRQSIADLIGAAAPPPSSPALSAAISLLEKTLAEEHFVSVPNLVQRIVGGWLVGDIVVLVGPTGSGKTFLAQTLGKGLALLFGKERFIEVFLEVGPDYDISQFLGYENLAGEFTAGRFAKEVLFVGEPSDPRLVVLDEWNLAQIDAYFAPVLSVIESKVPLRLPGALDLSRLRDADAEEIKKAQPAISDGRWSLPEDTFFLATCNSWADEPETRLPISGPVKRRCRIIPMPNVLDIRFREKRQDGIIEICDTILAQERKSLEERKGTGQTSVWDKHREERLAAISSMTDLQEKTWKQLLQLTRLLIENAHTRSNFTIGILRDILLSCVYTDSGQDYQALGEQIADKVLHQVQGDPKILEVLSDLSREFPNAEEITNLAKRMGAFSGERRIRPLV